MPQLSIAIVVVVLLKGVFAFVQEYRADRVGQDWPTCCLRRLGYFATERFTSSTLPNW